VRTVLAALDVAAERGSATDLDRRHDLQLSEAHVTGIGLSPRRPWRERRRRPRGEAATRPWSANESARNKLRNVKPTHGSDPQPESEPSRRREFIKSESDPRIDPADH
jgi:hypothetical protein